MKSWFWYRTPCAWQEDGSLDHPVGGRILRYLLRRVSDEAHECFGHWLKPGQVFVGSRKGGDDLGITHNRFYRYVKRYEREGKLERKPTRNGTIITLIPLATYFEMYTKSGTQSDTQGGTQPGTQSGNKLNRKKEYRGNSSSLVKEENICRASSGDGPWPKL